MILCVAYELRKRYLNKMELFQIVTNPVIAIYGNTPHFYDNCAK